jgi:uncharacterized membrane protein HdeD (DUF308 family)
MRNSIVTSHPTGGSIMLGILLIFLGLLAVATPLAAGVAASLVFGWVILLGSATHFIYAWLERRAGAVLWQILIALVYLFAALWILFHPVGGVAALTLMLAFYIAGEGVLELAVFSAIRSLPGAAWFLADGIISLIVAALILLHWPSSSVWTVGTLIGVSLIMSGIARLTMAAQRHRLMVEM